MGTKHRVVLVIIALVVISVAVLYVCLLKRESPGLYRVTILPSLGGDQMGAHAINDRGQVVGIGQTADGQWHFFLWDRENGVQDFGASEWGRFAINNAGQVAGSLTDPNGDSQAFLWEPDKSRRFLGTLGGKTSQAMAINNRGQIVGISEMPDGSKHAFLWDDACGMQDLGTFGGVNSQARAINDAGVVFGYTDTPTDECQPFIWDTNDGMVAIGPSPANMPLNGVNNGSWAVGERISPGHGKHMALWRKDRDPKELFAIEGLIGDPALINDANQIVFRELDDRRPWGLPEKFFHARYRYCLWDPNHGMIQLDPYLPNRRKEDFYPMAVNNKGCIVGILASDRSPLRARAVVLEPIPDRWGK